MTPFFKQHPLWRSACTLVVLLLTASSVRAQKPPVITPPSEGIDAGNYVFNFGLTAGYRSATLTDAEGNANPFAEARYNESYNLQKGINLNSFNLYGERKGAEGFFDELYVTASGINDPFTKGSLRMRAFNSYDLKVDYTSAKYYLNRNDSIFSGLHKFDFTRNFFNASLDVDAAENVKVNVQYNSTGRDGDATFTHNPFNDGYKNINESNLYWVSVPRNDKTNDFLGSISLKLPSMTSLVIGGGIRSFTQTLDGSRVNDTSLTFYRPGGLVNGFSGIQGQTTLLSLNSSNFQPMTGYSYSENRDSKTPYFFFEGVSRPIDEIDVTANVRYEKTTENPSIVEAQTATAGALVKGLPVDSSYFFGINTQGIDLSRSTLTGSLNVTGHINDDLSITGRYQTTQTKEDGTANYGYSMILNTTVLPDTAGRVTTTSYSTTRQDYEGFVNYAPIEMLSMKAGVRFSSITPDVTLSMQPFTAIPDEELSAFLSEKTTSMTPYFNFNLRPVKEVRIDGRYGHTTNKATDASGADVNMPIRVVAKSIDDYSVGIQAQPITHMSTSLRYSATNGSSTFPAMTIPIGGEVQRLINLTDRPYTNDRKSISGSVGYSFGKTVSLFVSGEYRDNVYEIPITWGRGKSGATTLADQAFYGDSGTTPISQNTIDRYLDLTLRANPIEALHVEAGYSLMSSTGGVLMYAGVAVPWNGQATPNNKGAYPDLTRYGGPYSSYTAHAQASYDVTPNVGIMADYQLVYYKEDQVGDYYGLNNFKGSLLRGGFSLKF
ncbi:MAG: hypothetical protein Q8922_00215 [Bacteroidota bacterium]|nr:hypothetical protein [Bacteroidota bacterium]MDP4232457.1 hypothetical protein [Bacteroidota bacterium]MDP4241593.1 hypothetical protein [Bacteroidota bacterium]MDP4286337.1 hypothetical protein [Bacteroidota bacterium]